MIMNLLLVVFLVAILRNSSKQNQNMKAYKARYNSQTATYIKYDKRSVKAWSIAVAVTGVVFGASIFLMDTNVGFWGNGKFGKTVVVMAVVMIGCSCYFLYKWDFMGDATVVLFVLLLIANALWILPTLFFRNQMNTQKFKDDVEIDVVLQLYMLS